MNARASSLHWPGAPLDVSPKTIECHLVELLRHRPALQSGAVLEPTDDIPR